MRIPPVENGNRSPPFWIAMPTATNRESSMTHPSGLVFVYTTLPDEAVAREIATELVRAKLAACVNIYPGMTSVYEWEGKLETGREVGCFIKTRESLTQKVMAALRKRHPYTAPAMLVLPILAGNADYLEWARSQTQGHSQ